MKWRDNTLSVKVAQLKLPGDIKARMKRPHVLELAESIRERTGGRPIHLPTVEWPGLTVLTGRDRIAAELVNGAKVIEVQTVSDLTAKERRDLERDENIHRRIDDRDQLIRERVAEREAEIELERRDVPPEKKPGRPKTARGEAREQVAREMGTTPDAVRVAEARAEAAENSDKSSETAPLTPPVETYGLPLVTNAEADQLRAVQAAIDEADQALRRAQAALKRVEGVAVFRGAQQLLARVHEAAAEVRAKRPAAVCPWCKRLPGLRCNGCGDSGFVGPIVEQAIADELKLGGDQAMVTVRGKLVPYAKAKDSEAAATAVRAGHQVVKSRAETGTPAASGTNKRVQVVDEQGKSLLPAVDEELPS